MQNDVQALLAEGLAHFSKGQHGPATECWSRVLELDPSNVRARQYLAYVRSTTPPSASTPARPVEQVTPTPAAPSPGTPAAAAEWFKGVPTEPPPPPPVVSPKPPAAAPRPTNNRVPGDPLFQEVLETWSDELSHALPKDIDTPPVPSAAAQVGPLVDEPAAAGDAAPETASAPAAAVWDLPAVTAEPAPPPPSRRNPFGSSDGSGSAPIERAVAPVTPPAPAVQVHLDDDANADGLGNMWESAERPAHVAPTGPVASPWDEGPAITSTVDLDHAGGGKPRAPSGRRTGSFRAVPNAPHATDAKPAGDVGAKTQALMVKVRDHYALGDFSGSLELVEQVLQLDDKNAEARDFLNQNASTLLKMYESKIGALDRVPRIVVAPDEIVWLNLHHKAGFILSRVDGMASFDDILALSGMSRLETCRILVQLLQAGVIKA